MNRQDAKDARTGRREDGEFEPRMEHGSNTGEEIMI
jgi:hypothetical protein